MKGARRFLTGQKVIRSCGTDKPKWKQNCSIGAFRQSIEPPYLWLLKGLRYLLTLWANYNKQQQNRKTFDKVNFNSWTTYCDLIMWHRQAQVKIKLLYRHLQKVYRDTLPLAFERPQVIINTEQTIRNNSRIEKSLTRWNKTLELYIVIRFGGTGKPKWRQNFFIGTFRKSVEISTLCFWKALGTYWYFEKNYNKQ